MKYHSIRKSFFHQPDMCNMAPILSDTCPTFRMNELTFRFQNDNIPYDIFQVGGDRMDGYMTTKEAAMKWGITQRQVQIHCKKNRIPNVVKVGTNYLIPENAQRPIYGYYYFGENDTNEGSTLRGK